jgi:hypothetical protein
MTSTPYRKFSALALVLFCLGLLSASLATAAEFPYSLEPRLSLTGECSTSAADPVPDPDCQGEPPAYPASPDRPAGRFDRPFSIAVDDWGDVYVASRSDSETEGRIDVFDSEGHFISELAAPNGPRSITVDGEGNLYAYEVSFALGTEDELVRYTPDVYNPAAGEIEYDAAARIVISAVLGGRPQVAIDRADPDDAGDDRLYVNEDRHIDIYSSAKTGNTLVDTIEPPGMEQGKYVAVDAERRRLYTTTCKNQNLNCVVWAMEADAPYNLLQEIDGDRTPAKDFFTREGKLSLAVDETNGHFFIGDLAAQDDIFEFDSSYDYVSRFTIPGGPLAAGVQSDVAENPKAPDPADLNPADNYRRLYVPLSPASGSALAFRPPQGGPAQIESLAATDIGETEAELSALIHPHELETTYEIRYVSEAQYAIDEFNSATPAAAGTIGAVPTPQSVSALIAGLSPGTAYRFLVTAENEFGEVEEEASFATHEDPQLTDGSCPNETLRTGASAALPDCRAYELVTPPDTAGRVPVGDEWAGEYFGMQQTSPSGEAVNFLITTGALPGTEASGYFFGDPYLATRGVGGWSTALAGPTGAQSSAPKPGGFSPDQGYSFWMANGEGSAMITEPTDYVRYPDGHSELIGRGSLGTDPTARGLLITEGGTHIVFRTCTDEPAGKAKKLEPEAPEEGIIAIYDRTRNPVTGAEETHVVSLLPDGTAPSQHAEYLGASAEGEAIAFKLGTSLYLRVANERTYAIGAPGATFAGVSDRGGRVFYLEGGDLEAFDTATEEVTTFADTAAPVTPVNVAPQGGRAYFVSATAISGSGPNPVGDTALSGAQNLYLSEGEGTPEFIATLTERDVEGDQSAYFEGDGLGLWTESLRGRRPSMDPSRLTPDGSVFVFQSRAELDGYEPGDEPQVYRYDHLAGSLDCVSCPPTGTPATSGAVLQSVGYYEGFEGPLSLYSFVPALRADAKRLFFESTEALRSSDVDGLRDVYEWEAEGVGSCRRKGGCVYLISSGRSAHPDYLFGHSPSGEDVFIQTSDALLDGDQQTASIYDARAGGGFASSEPAICAEEACRSGLTPPPALSAPQSGAQGKSGNAKNAKSCPRGKHKVKRKGRVICVKKQKEHKKHRKAGAKKGAGR